MSLSLKIFLKTIGTKHASYNFKIEPILVKFGSPTVCFHPFINVSHTFFTKVIIISLCSNKVSFSSPPCLSEGMVAILFKRKWLTNYCMLDAKGSLLVSVYVHSVLPSSHLHLALSLIMSCTLVHSFVLFNNGYRMQPQVPQICKLDGLS
jgi:phosphoribulokinase